jgi:hypothetical protein
MNEPEIVRLKNSVSLGVARFVRDMDENSFLKHVDAEYQAALFD